MNDRITTQHAARYIVAVLFLLGGLFLATFHSEQEAQAAIPADVMAALGREIPGLPAASSAGNAIVTCAPSNSWNPDAGQGLVAPPLTAALNTYSVVNVEVETTTPVYFCWRDGTTKANYATVCRKRCVGCNNGSSYAAEVSAARANLFCIVTSTTDAGLQVAAEFAR